MVSDQNSNYGRSPKYHLDTLTGPPVGRTEPLNQEKALLNGKVLPKLSQIPPRCLVDAVKIVPPIDILKILREDGFL